jgi:REP element-mobilizing transposase RayT
MKKHLLPIVEIYSYCLLKNHFHLLIKTKEIQEEKKISYGFSNLFNAYAKAINKAYNRKGSLFQRKFGRIKIDEENYLKKLILYIHFNPQAHGFMEDFKEYPYSSYNSMLSKKPTLLERNDVVGLFDNVDNFKKVHNDKKLEFSEEEIYLE